MVHNGWGSNVVPGCTKRSKFILGSYQHERGQRGSKGVLPGGSLFRFGATWPILGKIAGNSRGPNRLVFLGETVSCFECESGKQRQEWMNYVVPSLSAQRQSAVASVLHI